MGGEGMSRHLVQDPEIRAALAAVSHKIKNAKKHLIVEFDNGTRVVLSRSKVLKTRTRKNTLAKIKSATA